MRRLRTGAALRQRIKEGAALLYRTVADAKFDLLNRVDTSGYIPPGELGIAPSGHAYQASPERKIVSAIRSLPIEFRKFTFIDLGSGKGRVLVVAARFRFRQIIGVEISAALCRVASENTRRFPNVSIVCGDAGGYRLPAGACVVYLGNPFEAEVMAAVLGNVEERWKRDPSPIYLVYLVPECRRLLDAAPFLRHISSPGHCPVYVTREDM